MQSRSLLTADEYKLLSFEFLDTLHEDFAISELVLKMFTELEVTEKFQVSLEV